MIYLYQHYGLSEKKIVKMMEPFPDDAKLIYPREIPKVIEKDPDDNQILACALEGEADFIVSGDRHLLNLKSCRRVKIVSSREFIEMLEK